MDYDNSNFNVNFTTTGHFDEKIKANKFAKVGESKDRDVQSKNNYFSGDSEWLSGKHMHEFLQQIDGHNDTLEHCIVDRSGKSTTAKWEF